MKRLTAADVFHHGGIIAYPTEAVFGLGCDPDNDVAINKLLSLKQRSKDKGFILLAGNYSQLLPYIDEQALSAEVKIQTLSRWPGPITQIMPMNKNISSLLSGAFDMLAVRVTNHPDIVDLCQLTGKPIISTSANVSGQPSAMNWQQVVQQFPDQIDFIIKTETLGFQKPSSIVNALTGEIIRA
jgi:L-threonylcarbamoyladenylate synthase